MAVSFSTEQLADRWYDRRDVANLAGKYVTSLLLKQESQIFSAFWSGREDVCLGFHDGYYIGPAAVRAYYDAAAAATAQKSAFLRALLPEQLGGLSHEALFGVGQLQSLPITTPVIEIAADGATAKGIWHVLGSDNDVTPAGPLSYWSLGYLCIDFIREADDWKLWHVLYAEDIRCPMGENWANPQAHPTLPAFAPLENLPAAPYTIARCVHPQYSPERPFTPPPPLPEPYDTFSNTFSYGPERGA